MTGAGIEHDAADWLPPGTVLTNNRGVHAPKAEQFAMTALLMLNERIPETISVQREGLWRRHYATAIQGKTALIIGVGNMGVAAAKAARKLGLHVLGIRRSGKSHRSAHEIATPDRLHDMMRRADFVVVTAPLTLETEGLVDAAALDCLKPTAGLVNMGRARIVDYEALQVRLSDGRLRGAVLMFSTRTFVGGLPLWTAPNVIITPHVSSDDEDNYGLLTIELVFENPARWYAGKPLRNVVDAGLRY